MSEGTDIRTVPRPDREPDFCIPAVERLYAVEMWVDEGIIGFNDLEAGVNVYYTKFRSMKNGYVTVAEHIEYVIANVSHPHHEAYHYFLIDQYLLEDQYVAP